MYWIFFVTMFIQKQYFKLWILYPSKKSIQLLIKIPSLRCKVKSLETTIQLQSMKYLSCVFQSSLPKGNFVIINPPVMIITLLKHPSEEWNIAGSMNPLSQSQRLTRILNTTKGDYIYMR